MASSCTPRIRTVAPMSYLPFLGLVAQSRMVLTDSGGIQEESTVLGIPCLTMRPNTERPITCEIGTNVLVATDHAGSAFDSRWPHSYRQHPREVGRPCRRANCGRPPRSTRANFLSVRVKYRFVNDLDRDRGGVS